MTRRIAVGRIVRYIDPISTSDSLDELVRAAMIVKVIDEGAGIVNLFVFNDDGTFTCAKDAQFKSAIQKVRGSWHWPPRAPFPPKKQKPKT